jgi:hypothetical protein
MNRNRLYRCCICMLGQMLLELPQMNGGGKRDLFASLYGADHAPAGSRARQLGHSRGHSRVADRYDTVYQHCPRKGSTHIQIPIENHHLVIHNPSPISALYKWQEIMFRENRFVLHDRRQVCVSGRFRTLPSSEVDIDEAKRSIIDDHSSDDGSLVSIDSTNTPVY